MQTARGPGGRGWMRHPPLEQAVPEGLGADHPVSIALGSQPQGGGCSARSVPRVPGGTSARVGHHVALGPQDSMPRTLKPAHRTDLQTRNGSLVRPQRLGLQASEGSKRDSVQLCAPADVPAHL